MNIYLSSKADKQLSKLPVKMHDLLVSRIEMLSEDPYQTGCKKLENRDGYRVRIGDYRIIYTVDKFNKEITILSLAHRKEAYRMK